MEKIKVGVVGTGFIGCAHVDALRRLGFVEIVAVAEDGQELAESKARLLKIPRAYGDYHKLMADKEISVIHNCTPNYLHFEISRAALLAGKNVLSEKPLTVSRDEAEELVNLASEKGLVNGINFNYRFNPLVQQAKRMIEDGELGKIYNVRSSYLQDWLLDDTVYNWRVESRLGGSSLEVADLGSHSCDLIQYLTGLSIQSVLGDLRTVIPLRKKPKKGIETFMGKELRPEEYEEIKVTLDDYATVLLKLEEEVRGVFIVSSVSAGRKNRFYLEIDGSKKSLAWNQERPNELWIGYKERPNEVLIKDPSLLKPEVRAYAHYPGGHPEGYPDAFRNLFSEFYKFILSKKDQRKEKVSFPTFEDGLKEMIICEKILESNEKKGWVKI